MQPQADEARVELVVDLPAEPLHLQLDPDRIVQVLANLIGNALKFTPPGGRVHVRCLAAESTFRCEVVDTGVGIAPADRPRLFQRFGQLEIGARKRGSTGLGLSISKAIVEAHGGQIGVDSEPGRGSTFWFTLPRPQPGP
jgi:signal transduction histidine kinase